MVLFAGVTLTFGMWWVYFLAPMGDVLDVRRSQMSLFSFGQLPIYMSIAAVGAGLHVAAYYVEGQSEIGLVGTILAVAIPVSIFIAIVYGAWPLMMRMSYLDPLHIVLVALTAVVVGASLAMASASVELAWCLAVVSLAPWVSVVGFELIGHRHVTQQLADLRAGA